MSKKKIPLVAPTIESQIEAIQRKLAENPPAREFAALSRTLAQLTGAITRSRQQQWKDKKAEQEAARERALEQQKATVSRQTIRFDLIDAVRRRLRNATEQTLKPEEIEQASAINFPPEELLTTAKNCNWNETHPDEHREFHKLNEDIPVPSPEFDELQMAVKTNQPGSYVRWLIAFPRVFVNAGPTLTPEELRQVEQGRSSAAAAREQRRRALYEKYPERFAKELREMNRVEVRQ